MLPSNCRTIGFVLCVSSWMAHAQSTTAPSSATVKQNESASKQIAAGQKQTGPVPPGSFFSSGWAGPPMIHSSAPDCPVLPPAQSEPLIADAASRHKLDPMLLKALISQESAFYPCAVSGKGAIGLMQIMPETARTLNLGDPFDPAQNVDSGALYLKQMLDRFHGDVKLALAAYNAGPEKVDAANSAIPDFPETRDYVQRIMQVLNGTAGGAGKTQLPSVH